MKVTPNYRLDVLAEETFWEDMTVIDQQLQLCKNAGTFAGFDGQQLYYEYFQVEDSRGAIVLVHGLSEFLEKYHELAWYLLNQGYDVFIYDQRCHGRSCRLTDRMDLLHVDHFSDYQKDLHRFVCDVVRPVTQGPLYLYGHSMGGAVAAQYLAAHPEVFEKAVISAPMILPLTGSVPAFFAHWGLSVYLLFGDGKKKFWSAAEYDPDYPFERSKDRSRARFLWNMEKRHKNPCYCTTPQSMRWVQQAVGLRRKLTARRFLRKIRTPLLMICAEADGVVCEKAQQRFARRCGACRRVVIPNSTHSMLCGTRETITEHVQLVLDHFG